MKQTESIPWRDAFPKITDEDGPAVSVVGAGFGHGSDVARIIHPKRLFLCWVWGIVWGTAF